MLATSGLDQIGVGVLVGLLVVAIAAAAKAGPLLLGKRQTERRDAMSTYERLYGKPANPRTGEPATKGWTDHVDETLNEQSKVIKQTSTDIGHVRREIQQMGGKIMDNVDASAKAAAGEVIEQISERDRVQKRDAERDGTT